MPELPEAETIARTLAPAIAGRVILSAEFRAARVSTDDPARLVGSTITGTRRYGKQVLLDLLHSGSEGGSACLFVKLGMTGALLVDAEPGTHTRAVFTLSGGSRLLFDDIRQFGSFRLLLDGPPAHLGPDPLEIGVEEFLARLRERRGALKPLLLNQAFLRGLGNIYTDEALFRAGLHPLRRAEQVSRAAATGLHAAIGELLTEAIACRGSSISDYVDASGARGSFQERHRVYGKEGAPCPACGTSIARIVIAQRGTHFCPRCQPVPRRSARQ